MIFSEQTLREQLCSAHKQLPALGLVTWTSGNISTRLESSLVPGFLIKPSGINYDILGPEDFVHVDKKGNALGKHKPSTDTLSHLWIYLSCPEVNAIVHTHSPYATAFAAKGMSIPCAITSIADEFGGDIPCSKLVSIGGMDIGVEVSRVIHTFLCPAVLLRSHGVFTVGASIDAALKAAVMVEDAARIMWLAAQLGNFDSLPERLPDTYIEEARERYSTSYGQKHA